jgi:dTDP-4-dehydrorhamnose 3,5-epimerase
VKPFHEVQLAAFDIRMNVREEFYSTSAKNVLRGMHFQTPPHAHQKLIYCIKGKVSDVVLDLRRESPTYGQSVSLELSSQNKHVLYLPVGMAHGFLSLEDDCCLVYKTDAVYSHNHDRGILWNSFGHDWDSPSPIISQRDLDHPRLEDYLSPFSKIAMPIEHLEF